MLTLSYLSAAVWGGAFILTLVLARYLTPAAWWRQANARALAVLVAGTWGIGALLSAWLLPAQALARAALPAPERFVAYQALNLRSAPGISAKRIATVPAQSDLVATGRRQGDWWQVIYRHDTVSETGWASSLWLRRPGELGLPNTAEPEKPR
ncbi:MAG TPA: SH3 domain-containing protein [Telluria sp.]|nr:SH3 domain-containing protein [Telluria sp.]